MIRAYERLLDIPVVDGHHELLAHFARSVAGALEGDEVPVRFVVSATTDRVYRCELGVITGLSAAQRARFPSIFDFRRRTHESASALNVVLIVPTGIGCTIGGHAGDANPVARLLGEVADTVVTHPNVVNASDMNDLPDNGLYVEGSIVTRLMMGTAGLEPVRSNRVLVAMDQHEVPMFVDMAVNSVSAARAVYGLSVPEVVVIDPPMRLTAVWAESGRATGTVSELEGLLEVLEEYKGQYDAVALSSQVRVPFEYHSAYYEAHGEMVNPWGGAEALLTHVLSLDYGLPFAHAPMLESREVVELEMGRVDPRMAAEEISTGFLECVLKGLQRSPRIVQDAAGSASHHGVITIEDVSCLVIPDKAIGLPTLAALEHGVPVIAVRGNENLLENDLTALPWAPGQLFLVENYLEAAGILAAMRAGIDPASVLRPLVDTHTMVHEGHRTHEV